MKEKNNKAMLLTKVIKSIYISVRKLLRKMKFLLLTDNFHYLFHFELDEDRFSKVCLAELYMHIQQLQLEGYQTEVIITKGQIPNDCIGVETVRYQKKLIYRTYLQIQKEVSERKIIVFRNSYQTKN